MIFSKIFMLALLATAIWLQFKPDVPIEWNRKYFEWWIKAFGFEGQVRTTPKTKKIFFLWNGFLIIYISLLTILLLKYGR